PRARASLETPTNRRSAAFCSGVAEDGMGGLVAWSSNAETTERTPTDGPLPLLTGVPVRPSESVWVAPVVVRVDWLACMLEAGRTAAWSGSRSAGAGVDVITTRPVTSARYWRCSPTCVA